MHNQLNLGNPLRGSSTNMSEWDFGEINQSLQKPWSSEISGVTGQAPRCETIKTPEQYLLLFDLPGQDKAEIKVELDNDRIIVSGERRPSMASVNGRLLQSEFFYGAFFRTFMLPGDANGEQIDASYANGVLKVAVPRLSDRKSKEVAIH